MQVERTVTMHADGVLETWSKRQGQQGGKLIVPSTARRRVACCSWASWALGAKRNPVVPAIWTSGTVTLVRWIGLASDVRAVGCGRCVRCVWHSGADETAVTGCVRLTPHAASRRARPSIECDCFGGRLGLMPA